MRHAVTCTLKTKLNNQRLETPEWKNICLDLTLAAQSARRYLEKFPQTINFRFWKDEYSAPRQQEAQNFAFHG